MSQLKSSDGAVFNTRRAYIFLLSLAVICAILGIVVTTSDEFLTPSGERAAENQTGDMVFTDTESQLPPEVIAYTGKVAKEGLYSLMGRGIGDVTLTLDGSGEYYLFEADNLRVTFSAYDGSLESFVHVRVGDSPDKTLSREECLNSAIEFLNRAKRGKKADHAAVTHELCGFIRADITAGDDTYSAVIDSFGRVWSLFKVKRS